MVNNEALQALNLRLAKGEITPEQYDELRQRITAVDPPPSNVNGAPQQSIGDDPVVVELTKLVQERADRLTGNASIVLFLAGLIIGTIQLVLDRYFDITNKVTSFFVRLAPPLGDYAWLPARFGAVFIAAGIVLLFVFRYARSDYLRKPVSPDKFASLTLLQRSEIARRLQTIAEKSGDKITLHNDHVEYKITSAIGYAFVAGIGAVTPIVVLLLYLFFTSAG